MSMGIYLPNMEMPTQYPLWIVVSVDGTIQYNFSNEWETAEEKAVPVPPHGKLGDLDALAKRVEYELFHHAHTDGLAARYHVAEYGHFLKEIVDAPTIIPAGSEGE